MEDGEFVAKVWLAIWRTFVQIFYLVVVIAVFGSIHTPLAKLVTALGGILYATIRSGFLGLSLYFQSILPGMLVQADRIHDAVTQQGREIEPAELSEEIKKSRTPAYFDIVGLSLIYFICLFELFDATSGGEI